MIETDKKKQQIIENIWIQLSKPIRAFISKHVSNNSIVDDLLQDIFLKIHLKIDSLKENEKLESWVFQIARNQIIDYYRMNNKKFDNVEKMPIFEEAEQNIHFEEIDKKLLVEQGLKHMVNLLPDKYAQALYKVDFEGESQINLAKETGISVSGAKSRVQRGRKMLKDTMLACCDFEFDKYGNFIDYQTKDTRVCKN